MMGSLHEADDLVQETYLRAWKAFERFDGVAPRAWLFRIATNVCLNALEARRVASRFLPQQLGPSTEGGLGAAAHDVPWLEPIPDALLDSRESVQLAFVAALQQLPPRQRAAVVLCEVLGWPVSEAAEMLEGTTASLSSALQRARQTLAKRAEPTPAASLQPKLERYMRAWSHHDVGELVALLRDDAAAVMPPWREWFLGRETISRFFTRAWNTCAGMRVTPLTANGQPACAVYERSANTGRYEASAIHVLTFDREQIATMTLFLEPRLFDAFDVPRSVG